MKKILLVGNPNVGKSVVFSRLTGARVLASNYPGTTVEFTRGRLRFDGEPAEVIDVPGTYSLDPSNPAEEVAVRMIPEGDLLINVVDATNLERNLNLTLGLLDSGKPVIVALNMCDEATHKGIEIDFEALERSLGVPVVPTCALSGQGISTLLERAHEARAGSLPHDPSTRWARVGHLVGEVQRVTHRHHTWLERLADASLRPSTGVPLALLVGLVAFALIRLIGEGLIGYVLEPFFDVVWAPVVLRLSALLGPDTFIHTLLIGELVNGEVDFLEAMGLLTTALFVSLAAVLPYIIAFYLVLGLIEDLGYLPRLGVLVDTLMHHLGLHGLSIIPFLLGLGCNVPGALATRIFETRRQRFVAATLMAICVPCAAQLAMIVGLLGPYGVHGLGPLFLALFGLWIVLALAFKLMLPGEAPEIFVEIPPYRLPVPRVVAQKLWLRVRQYLTEAVPFVILGVFVVVVLQAAGVMRSLEYVFGPVLTALLGLPENAVAALVVGFLRKDVAVGMLAPLGLTLKQLIVACVVLVAYFPCAATFAILFKEFGARDMLKSMVLMVLAALTVGALLNLIL